ncbi:MAG: putative Ig proteinputative calcium-binding proteinFG-GAP repeat protein [Myxococcales bacterium]|nr:putative Ig proteinputative calcium-binding proteinFG-GAP repeat protein [Myxococcales bacterium]
MRVGVVWLAMAAGGVMGAVGCFAGPPGGGGGGAGGGGAGGGGAGGGGGVGVEGALLFAPQTAIPTASGRVAVTGDVNKDSRADLVVGGNGPTGDGGNALLGSGTGSFTTGALFSTVAQPSWFALGDLNGDGNLDLVAALGSGAAFGNVALALGNGAGGFAMASGLVGEPQPISVVTGDFNQDGKSDVATANGNGGAGTGASVFLSGRTTHDNYNVGRAPAVIASGDWNGDGQIDLVVGGGDATSGNFTILLGKADGSFGALGMVALTRAAVALGSGDLDGDGRLDLVVGLGGGDILVALGKGDGTFTLGATVHALSGPGAVTHVVVADFNGGGRLDVATLVLPAAGQAYLTVLLGNGNGTLQAPVKFGTFDTTGITAASLTSGDYDGDGRRDLAVAHGNVDLFLNRSR